MLDKTKELAIEHLEVLKGLRVDILDNFKKLGVEGVEIEGVDLQHTYNELDNIIVQIDNKVTTENRVETRRFLDVIKNSSEFKDRVVKDVNLKIRNYNKRNKTALLAPTFEELEDFIKNNQDVFLKHDRVGGLVFITKGMVVSDTAWAILKKSTAVDYLELRKKADNLKRLMIKMDTIDSNIANLNYFFDYYDYIKKHKVKRVYWLNFSDGRGRLYIKSPVSIQAN
jgi:hypothetical protein